MICKRLSFAVLHRRRRDLCTRVSSEGRAMRQRQNDSVETICSAAAFDVYRHRARPYFYPLEIAEH